MVASNPGLMRSQELEKLSVFPDDEQNWGST
jgi:hypothetical protein